MTTTAIITTFNPLSVFKEHIKEEAENYQGSWHDAWGRLEEMKKARPPLTMQHKHEDKVLTFVLFSGAAEYLNKGLAGRFLVPVPERFIKEGLQTLINLRMNISEVCFLCERLGFHEEFEAANARRLR